MRFRAIVVQTGKTTTGIPIPAEVLAALGAGKKPAVTVNVNGHTYRSSVATVDGVPMVSLSAENRVAAAVRGGDEVEVDIDLDTAPRTVDIPPELSSALDREPAARAFFDSLSYSNQRWHVLSITGAKTAETRERRVQKSMSMLREGRKP
jgi:hypothetical protein